MKSGIVYTGEPSAEELSRCPGRPSPGRLERGPVAVIECVQEIPCNPCEYSCPRGAIRVGVPITGLPRLDEEKCTGCGACIPACPGLAIFQVDYNHGDGQALVSFPYEYLPLPREGDEVQATDRGGRVVTGGKVIKVRKPDRNDGTAVVSLAVPREFADQVRSMARLGRCNS
ncbi:4Fe-4S ferredoxin [Clostridiales bacterium PH28_bin88]|nr:4Fe-4S ferredoxin [Clostridiales bacterium PH28_bin88]